MKRDKVGGYMTLEAALIMPVVLFCITVILYIAYLEYNRAADLQAIEESIVVFHSMVKENEENEEQYIRSHLLNRGYDWTVQEREPNVEIKNNKIEMKLSTEIKTPFQGREAEKYFKYTIQRSYERVDAASFIRTCRKIKGGLDGIRK